MFASCKFIPIMCLQLRPVCTVCLQSGAINVIVRGCSCLGRLSCFSLPGFKWPLAARLPHCFSFPNVNASLDLYRPLYTLLFFISRLFPGWSTNKKGLGFTTRRQLGCVSALVTGWRGGGLVGGRGGGVLGGCSVGRMESEEVDFTLERGSISSFSQLCVSENAKLTKIPNSKSLAAGA